jgi:hypothetical protein
MLSAYMDETGHSKDEQQKFVGMAGLIAPAAQWEVFERKWKEILARKHFDIPYFHMTDFNARRKVFEGWSKEKLERLFGKLMITIECAHPVPFGAIVPMDDFRSFTKEEQGYFLDPYFVCFISLVASATTFMEAMKVADEEKIALIFSDQVEFKNRALKMYKEIEEVGLYTRRSTPPDFSDMRKSVPLQAADIVAYEMYKEFDRRLYRPNANTRYGFKRIEEMSRRSNFRYPMFRFFAKSDLAEMVDQYERAKNLKKHLEDRLKDEV